MNLRNLAIWGVIIALLLGLYGFFNQGAKTGVPDTVTYSQILQRSLGCPSQSSQF